MWKSIVEFGNELHMVVSTHDRVSKGGQIFGPYGLVWREMTDKLPIQAIFEVKFEQVCKLVLQILAVKYSFSTYRTRANRTPTFYFLFRFLSGVQFKWVVCSRGCSIQLSNFEVKEIWDINPETQKPVELEEIPDIDELENNELLVDDI